MKTLTLVCSPALAAQVRAHVAAHLCPALEPEPEFPRNLLGALRRRAFQRVSDEAAGVASRNRLRKKGVALSTGWLVCFAGPTLAQPWVPDALYDTKRKALRYMAKHRMQPGGVAMVRLDAPGLVVRSNDGIVYSTGSA